jgi:hypothetical protein
MSTTAMPGMTLAVPRPLIRLWREGLKLIFTLLASIRLLSYCACVELNVLAATEKFWLS